VSTPNKVHQADLLFLPHDKLPRRRKVYKYALTVVDMASRYKEAEPLTSKNCDEVAKAFQAIYKRSPLTWPEMLQVDPGRGRVEIHRDQAIVEHFNRTLAERLFGHQYAVEMRLPDGQRSTAWVKRLPEVVSALNNEVTSLIDKKPAVAIKDKAVIRSHRHLIQGLLEKGKNYSPPMSKFVISTSLVSLKVVQKGPQTRFGL